MKSQFAMAKCNSDNQIIKYSSDKGEWRENEFGEEKKMNWIREHWTVYTYTQTYTENEKERESWAFLLLK